MEFDFPDQTYLARVQYDPSKDKINRPLLSEERARFKELRRLIKKEKLTTFQLRPDIYSDEKGNQAIEFIDDENQINLIRVYVEDGQIFPPL